MQMPLAKLILVSSSETNFFFLVVALLVSGFNNNLWPLQQHQWPLHCLEMARNFLVRFLEEKSVVTGGILSSVLSYDTSFDVWRSIEKQFGVQSEAKIMQLRYEMNILRKDSMNVEEYCAKMKLLANKLACAGDVITENDLLMRVLNGLGSGYLDLASIITANKMSYDDA
ncbi:hypothetical protein WN943_028990 [Citrus x changshan-huyou]